MTSWSEARIESSLASSLMNPGSIYQHLAAGNVPRLLMPWLVRSLTARLPPSVITIRLVRQQFEPYVREALDRALRAAILVWNHSLEGVLRFQLDTSSDLDPAVAIRAQRGVLPGGRLGHTLFTSDHRCTDPVSTFAQVRVALGIDTESGGPCFSPAELYAILCHELGHVLGLDEYNGEGRVMARFGWHRIPPRGPFNAERVSILRYLRVAQSALGRAYCRIGDRACVEEAMRETRLADVRDEVEGSGVCVDPLLTEVGFAPERIAAYWGGTWLVQHGRPEEGVELYGRSVVDGAWYPEQQLRYGWLRVVQGDVSGLALVRDVVERCPHWLYARKSLMHLLEWMGDHADASVLRRGIVRLGLEGEFDWRKYECSFIRSDVARVMASVSTRVACWVSRVRLLGPFGVVMPGGLDCVFG